MVLTVFALAAGLVAGRMWRSPFRHLAEPRLRWWPLLPAGVLLQVLAGVVDVAALVPISYAVLAVFVLANLHLVGMPVVLVGLGLNLLVISLNGGMPVRGEALVDVGLAERDELSQLSFDTGRHLEGPDDRLSFLGDVVPLPLGSQVVSFGDLVLLVGAADVAAHLARRHRRDRRRRSVHGRPGSVMLTSVLDVRGPSGAPVAAEPEGQGRELAGVGSER
jgi:hypothetical protein